MAGPTDHADAAEEAAILVPHAEFRAGLPAGHFRLIVNPDRARKYVRHRLLIFPISLSVAGVGVALALVGHAFWGIGLVALAVLANRVVSAQAANILLHLATQDERVYFQAMEFEILEVRRAR
jgi:multisubunit Na+/H+ antiporter MnhB subunit